MQHHVQTVSKDYRCGSRKLSFESLTHCLLRSKVILCTRGLVQRLGLDGPDKTFSLNITDGSGSRAFRQKSLSVLQSDVSAACIELPEVYHLHQCSSTGVPRNPRVPWNMWWGSVRFKGSTRVPRLFREIDFLLQHFDE